MKLRNSIVLLAVCFSSAALAGESCQALVDKISSHVAAANQLPANNRTAKCRAYEMVALDLGGVAAACSASQGDVDLAKAKFPPLAKQVADGEQQFCGR